MRILFLSFLLVSCITPQVAISPSGKEEASLTYHFMQDHLDKDFLEYLTQLYDPMKKSFNATPIKRENGKPSFFKVKFKNKSYLLKTGVKRLIDAEKIKSVIAFFGFKKVKFPPKKLFHIPGQPLDLSDENYYVVVELVEGSETKFARLNTKDAEELLLTAYSASLWDLTRDNVIFDGRSYWLIDTEIKEKNKKSLTESLKCKFVAKLNGTTRQELCGALDSSIFASLCKNWTKYEKAEGCSDL